MISAVDPINYSLSISIQQLKEEKNIGARKILQQKHHADGSFSIKNKKARKKEDLPDRKSELEFLKILNNEGSPIFKLYSMVFMNFYFIIY